MLPEAGAFELVFLAMVALVVVGPKDLPMLLRKVGQFTAKMRGLAGEFRASFDEMARQSELDDLRREVEALRDGRFGDTARPELESHVADINKELNFDGPHPAPAGAYGSAPAATDDAEPELPLPAPAAAPASDTSPSEAPPSEAVGEPAHVGAAR